MKPAWPYAAHTVRDPARRALVVFALTSASLALAQSGGGYDLHWNVPAGGGGSMSGANGFVLNGTVAQADASPAAASNGANGYAVRGGFWAGVHENDVIFRDGFGAGP